MIMIDKILYIDPGTGSMLFSIIIGIAGVLVFAVRALWIKFKFVITGGRSKASDSSTMPICIFSEGKRYWNVFSPICDEFEKRQKDIWYLTASSDDPALSKDYKYIHPKFIGEGNKALSKMNLIKADIVLATTPGLDVYQWKRSKGVKYYVHIPHMPGDIDSYRMLGLDFYDAILLSGQHQADRIRKLESIRGIPEKELKLVGIPYMDKMKERLDSYTDPEGAGKKEPVVLLAPSWGESGILSIYGAPFIDLLIKTGYKIIIRPHPQSFTSEKDLMDSLMKKYPETDRLKWNRDPDNFDVLNESDILISDFSGVIFDFTLVFNKPLIYTNVDFDIRPFDADWIDETPWTLRILPDLGIELGEDNVGNIKELIDKCIDDPSFTEGREKARDEAWGYIGEGANRSADFVIEKYNEVVAKKAEEERKAKTPAKTNSKKKTKKIKVAQKGA